MRTINDLWTDTNIYGSTNGATQELAESIGDNNFTYPKPEKLLKKIIKVATDKGDIVLDFYAGSGTTLVAAHKLNRQYIGVELLEDNFRLIIKRLRLLIKLQQNNDRSFITAINEKGNPL